MPNLGDYLGQLIAELTRARMHGDAEAVRVADRFSAHPVLKHFPIPRFRMLNVQIDIPVAIQNHDARDVGAEKPVEAKRGVKATKRVAKILRKEMKYMRFDAPESKRRLETALQKRAAAFERAGALPESVTEAVDDMTNTLRDELAASTIEESNKKQILVRFENSLHRELLEQQQQLSGLEVLVATSELKNLASPELITRIKLTLSEEGVEWKQSESNGRVTSRLRPE